MAAVTGVIPPLDDSAWQSEFAKYRGTPQYDLINRGIGLAGFKAIYWWEWTHRMLGRVLGVVFLIPFLVFVRQDASTGYRYATRHHLPSRRGAGRLGVVDGAVGPYRRTRRGQPISSGRASRSRHDPVRLCVWTALEITGAARSRIASGPRFQTWAALLVVLIFVQILLGAFMAGLDAGRAFSSWPSYAGAWIPSGLYDLSPWWINHFENPALVHFQHRSVGMLWRLWLWRSMSGCGAAGLDRSLRIAGIHAVVLTALQIALGIFTVVTWWRCRSRRCIRFVRWLSSLPRCGGPMR